MLKEIKVGKRKYIINIDRLLYMVTMFILLSIFVVGCSYVSNQEYLSAIK